MKYKVGDKVYIYGYADIFEVTIAKIKEDYGDIWVYGTDGSKWLNPQFCDKKATFDYPSFCMTS